MQADVGVTACWYLERNHGGAYPGLAGGEAHRIVHGLRFPVHQYHEERRGSVSKGLELPKTLPEQHGADCGVADQDDGEERHVVAEVHARQLQGLCDERHAGLEVQHPQEAQHEEKHAHAAERRPEALDPRQAPHRGQEVEQGALAARVGREASSLRLEVAQHGIGGLQRGGGDELVVIGPHREVGGEEAHLCTIPPSPYPYIRTEETYVHAETDE